MSVSPPSTRLRGPVAPAHSRIFPHIGPRPLARLLAGLPAPRLWTPSLRTPRRGAAFVIIAAVLAAGCGGDIETRMSEVRALQDVGQFTESIDELREILAISPNLPEANYRLGVALRQTGEPSRAVWALQKASESPDYAIVAGLMLASVHSTIQNHEEAIRAANSVLEVDPERMVALLIRAQAHVGAMQLEEAWEDTKRLVELYPDEYRVRALEATVLSDLGRIDEAEAAAYRLKEMSTSNPIAVASNQSRCRSCEHKRQ